MQTGPTPPPPARPPLRRAETYSGQTDYLGWMLKFGKRGAAYMTMSPGQWDSTLSAGYDLGYTLIEVNDDENVVATYQRED